MERVKVFGTGKIVRFLARDGIKLSGILCGPQGSKTCIIYIHGMGGSLSGGIPQTFGSRTGKSAFFAFNNRGHDLTSSVSRYVGRRRTRLIAGTNFERFEDSVYDVGGAIDAMSMLGFTRFVLCGHSTGCQKAIYYKYKTGDRKVSAIVLLAPADDYNLHRKELGRGYRALKRRCEVLIRQRKGDIVVDQKIGFSAQRLDSVLNLGRVEARLLNYDGDLKEFGEIKTPILAVFGSMEEYRLKPVATYLSILSKKTGSSHFSELIVENTDHSFSGKEELLASEVYSWIGSVINKTK